MVTKRTGKPTTEYALLSGVTVPSSTAEAMIRNGWVRGVAIKRECDGCKRHWLAYRIGKALPRQERACNLIRFMGISVCETRIP